MPACVCVGGVPLIVGGIAGGAVTWMLNVGSGTLVVPSLTLITMFEYVPTFAVAGMPLSCPVVVLNVAHEGLLEMANVSVLPSASDAAGWNEYCAPACTVVAGVPVILGGVLVGGAAGIAVTVIANAASATLVVPSLTLMTMFGKLPTLLLAGVPLSSPVEVLNDAHDGLPVIENTNGSPLESDAEG